MNLWNDRRKCTGCFGSRCVSMSKAKNNLLPICWKFHDFRILRDGSLKKLSRVNARFIFNFFPCISLYFWVSSASPSPHRGAVDPGRGTCFESAWSLTFGVLFGLESLSMTYSRGSAACGSGSLMSSQNLVTHEIFFSVAQSRRLNILRSLRHRLLYLHWIV